MIFFFVHHIFVLGGGRPGHGLLLARSGPLRSRQRSHLSRPPTPMVARPRRGWEAVPADSRRSGRGLVRGPAGGRSVAAAVADAMEPVRGGRLRCRGFEDPSGWNEGARDDGGSTRGSA